MKRTVLFHVQHFLGMGHLVRAFALAEALAEEFRVVIASGGTFPPGVRVPAEVELINLPALGLDDTRMLVNRVSDVPLDRVLALRKRRLLDLYDEIRPDVVLVELFPFGRKKLAAELLGLLQRARSDPGRPLVVSSVRDLLVTGRHDQRRHDDRAAEIGERLLDLVLVHGDRRFATLAQTFRPSRPFRVPIAYTGFVAGREPPSERSSPVVPGSVVVSAGGGWVGGSLMRAALDAAPILASRHGMRTTLITGPLADERENRELHCLALARPTVEIVGHVPGLLPTLREATASISQAGYNTTVDLLRAGVPAVLVPYGDERENEQPRRAALLAEHGLARVVEPTSVTGVVLADAVTAALGEPPPTVDWRLDGAERTVAVLLDALRAGHLRAG